MDPIFPPTNEHGTASSSHAPEPSPMSDADARAFLRPDEPIPLHVEAWPMWVDIRPTWNGWCWQGTYGYALLEVGRECYGVLTPFVAWGRRGGHKLLDRFLTEHRSEYGNPPSGQFPIEFRSWAP